MGHSIPKPNGYGHVSSGQIKFLIIQRQRTWAGGPAGGQGRLEPPHFLIRGADPPKIGGCHKERIKY